MTSPRNSIAAHLDLFGRLKCNTLLSPLSQPPAVGAIQKEGSVRVVEVPEVEYLLDNAHPPYPYQKALPAASLEPLFIV